MVRIDGVFPEMHVRSELAQEKPYQPLAKVLETDQTFYNFEDVKGTVVGLYCPAYMNMLNAVGWHFHFISDDRPAVMWWTCAVTRQRSDGITRRNST